MSAQPSPRLLILFGLVFLCIGAGFGFFMVRTLLRAEAMLAWRETPAEVLACDLKVSHGSKGGSTYQVMASYRYEVEGRRYTGERVTLHSGSDNVGSFHHKLYAALEDCKRRRRPTTCWVNPDDPSEAILVRTIRPDLIAFFTIFVLAFGGSGFGVMVGGLCALTAAAPDDARGRIRMRGAVAHRVFVAVALVLNGYIGWTLWLQCRVLPPEQRPWYLWLPAAVGVLAALLAGYRLARFRKFGVSVLELSPLPGVIGGPVSGTVHVPAKLEAEDGAELKLECVRQVTTGSGKQRHTRCDVLWSDQKRVPASPGGERATWLSVRFTTPGEMPATTAAGGSDGVWWRLTASARAPGIDYKAVFDVPVKTCD